MTWTGVFVLLTIVSAIYGHTYHYGECPTVEPMSGFDMNRFLGVWYVIQKTSTASTCLTYNFTRDDEPGHYRIQQNSQHFAIQYTPVDHEYRYTGKLSVDDFAVPGRMTVKFPLSVGGSASYTIIGTDYENFAGIFTCQKLLFAHRRSATILSRTKTLDEAYVAKLRMKLSNANVNPFDLSIISQSNCPKRPPGTDPNYNINIDDQTFTAESAAGVVRKAGEKLGDGIEYIAGGAKKVYEKIAGNSGEHVNSRTQRERERLETSNPKMETEWLP